MLLQFEDGKPFASGAASYLYQSITERETTPRIILSILLGGIETTAFVDTGGVYVLCSPEIARVIGLNPGEGIPVQTLRSARGRFSGELFRAPLTFLWKGKALRLRQPFLCLMLTRGGRRAFLAF